MQIVIDINENLYSYISKEDAVYFPDDGGELFEAVKNGTPLPKVHGRLIDEDTIAGDGSWDWSDRLDATPTIIEADNAESEKE